MSDRSNFVDKPDGDNIRIILIECQKSSHFQLAPKAQIIITLLATQVYFSHDTIQLILCDCTFIVYTCNYLAQRDKFRSRIGRILYAHGYVSVRGFSQNQNRKVAAHALLNMVSYKKPDANGPSVSLVSSRSALIRNHRGCPLRT
jgi:hypothetical protein